MKGEAELHKSELADLRSRNSNLKDELELFKEIRTGSVVISKLYSKLH